MLPGIKSYSVEKNKMVKIFCLLILAELFFIKCNSGTTDTFPIDNDEGLSIYLSDVKINSYSTYQDINLETAGLIGKPIISYDQVVSYDTTNHVLALSFSRDSLVKKIGQLNVHGNSFIVTLDSQKIYSGWFWTPVSSIPCHTTVIMLPYDLSNSLSANEIKIRLGYPSEEFFNGTDPRNNKKIIERLIQDKKVK